MLNFLSLRVYTFIYYRYWYPEPWNLIPNSIKYKVRDPLSDCVLNRASIHRQIPQFILELC